MRKEIVKVPYGTQFISEWPGYELPRGLHCVINKMVTGCGFTEYCLTCKDNIILCSPRKLLLENKRAQHIKDPNILYLENNTTEGGSVLDMMKTLDKHIDKCQNLDLPVKVMVTFDSLKHLTKHIEETRPQDFLDSFIFVVDEFQCIFLDAFFKPEVELTFLENLANVKSVIYLSATPMLEKYMMKLDEFKDLTYYVLDWTETGAIETIKLQRKFCRSIGTEVGKIIDQYLRGDYPKTFRDGKWYESREAVFYVNSVKDILRIIQLKHLTPENTIVICSETDENKKKLKKKGFDTSKVPLKDEQYPMFMFCTRSVYAGVDMYSNCASTFIFADPNIDSLAMDISIDLPQIIGRQRNKENVFKNEITLFYKTTKTENLTSREEFDAKQEIRRNNTYSLLETWDGMKKDAQLVLREKCKSDIKVNKYAKDFISISGKTGKIVYNYLIEIADERAWDVIQKDYQDSVCVTRAIRDTLGDEGEEYKGIYGEVVTKFFNEFLAAPTLADKMKLYCKFRDKHSGNTEIENILVTKISDQRYNTYYSAYGTKECKAKRYRFNELEKMASDAAKEDKLKIEILREFKVGDIILKAQIKQKLKEIYIRLGIKKTPKATDLEEWFVLKSIWVKKTKENFFKIISQK